MEEWAREPDEPCLRRTLPRPNYICIQKPIQLLKLPFCVDAAAESPHLSWRETDQALHTNYPIAAVWKQIMNRLSTLLLVLLIALLSSARIGAQSAGHSYPWGDLNVPETGRRYVYVGVARGQNNNTSVIPVERIVEVGTVERAGDTLRYSTTDRITATDGSAKVLYDVSEVRRYDPAGEVLLLRNHAVPEPFPGDAPASVAFSDGLIAPPTYVDGQTYTYNGLTQRRTRQVLTLDKGRALAR